MARAAAGCEPTPDLPAARQLQVYPGDAVGPFALAAVAVKPRRAEKELRREHVIDVGGKLDVDAPEPEAPQP